MMPVASCSVTRRSGSAERASRLIAVSTPLAPPPMIAVVAVGAVESGVDVTSQSVLSLLTYLRNLGSVEGHRRVAVQEPLDLAEHRAPGTLGLEEDVVGAVE